MANHDQLSLAIPSPFTADIETAANRIYAEIRENSEWFKDPHRQGVCAQASHALLRSMIKIGYRPDLELHRGDTTAFHYFLTHPSAEGVLVIDPTWQQFLPENKVNPTLPKVLIATREGIVESAREAGILDNDLAVWDESSLVIRECYEDLIDW